MPGEVLVTFLVNCADTRVGQHVRAVGSSTALGCWNPPQSLILSTSAAEFPTWKSVTPARVKIEEHLEYKYVICESDGTAHQWEDGQNRSMQLSSLASHAKCVTAGSIAVAEVFNGNCDADEFRFRASPIVPHAASFSLLAHKPSGRYGPENELPPAEGDGSITDLFAPTIRVREPPKTMHDRSRSRSLLSVPAAVRDSMVVENHPEPEVTYRNLEDPDAAGVQPTRSADADMGLAREESCSNLFIDALDVEEVKDSSEFEDKYALTGNGPLGEGTFGLVWQCVPKQLPRNSGDHAKERAVKIVRKARLKPRDIRYLLGEDGEIRTHLTMKHPNIVRLFEYFDEPTTVSLILEYCCGGDLFDAIVRQSRAGARGLSEQAAAVVTQHVLSALAYIHSQSVVHRDVKCENVLLTYMGIPIEKNTFKLCDFGFATHDRGEGLSERLGSPDSVAPEVVLGSRYGTPTDLWSTGVLIYMMLTAKPPFYAPTDREVLIKVRTGSYSLSGEVWDSVSAPPKNMITSLMIVNPKLRPSAREALQKEWLKDVQQAGP